MRQFFDRIRSRRNRGEQALARELGYHLDRLVADLVQSGLDEPEARRRAAIQLGGMAQVQEAVRDTWRWGWLRDLGRDFRYALRLLRRSPGFTITAVASLALGIGANTAVFTVIDAVLLKTLPVRSPHELVLLRWAVPEGRGPSGAHWVDGSSWPERGRRVGTSFSYPTFQQIQNRGTGEGRPLSDVLAFTDLRDFSVVANGDAALAAGQLVSAGYFQALGIRPAVGRLFAGSDDRPGAAPVCVISERYWKRRFGGDPSIAGKAIVVNGASATIIGVTPPEFFGVRPGSAFDLALPLSVEPIVLRMDPKVSLFTAADHWWVQIIGRLNSADDPRRSQSVLEAIFRQVTASAAPPSANDGEALASLDLEPAGKGLSELRREFSRPLFILMAMVGLVLVIACVNVANLLLARAATRQREIGIRLAVGASGWRVIRQLLAEAVLLASLGGVVGCALAWWGSRLLVALISPRDNPILLDLNPDPHVLGFAAAACLVTGLLFGLAPAVRATRVDLAPALKGGRPGVRTGGTRLHAMKALIVAQATLSVVLVFGATLFVRTLVNLQSLNKGFTEDNLLLFGLDAAQAGYEGRALKDFYGSVQQRVASLPGVVSATASLHLMLGGGTRTDGIRVPGHVPTPGETSSVHVMPAGSGFFRTMRIRLLLGRDFTERDTEDAPAVAVVNETFAKRYFGDRNPIGQRIGWAGDQSDMEIVGVAADARYGSLRRESPATVYHPFRQATIYMMHFAVRTAVPPRSLIPGVRRVVASLDPRIPVQEVGTQEEKIDELLIHERLFAKLSSFFGLLALALVCVGLYGILTYAVARRTSEIGIRMALGASRASVMGTVLEDTLPIVTIGLLLGITASFGLARLGASVASDLLYGLEANDPLSLAIAGITLISAASLATVVPARRASHVDPVTAIRDE
jgi:predicted permease